MPAASEPHGVLTVTMRARVRWPLPAAGPGQGARAAGRLPAGHQAHQPQRGPRRHQAARGLERRVRVHLSWWWTAAPGAGAALVLFATSAGRGVLLPRGCCCRMLTGWRAGGETGARATRVAGCREVYKPASAARLGNRRASGRAQSSSNASKRRREAGGGRLPQVLPLPNPPGNPPSRHDMTKGPKPPTSVLPEPHTQTAPAALASEQPRTQHTKSSVSRLSSPPRRLSTGAKVLPASADERSRNAERDACRAGPGRFRTRQSEKKDKGAATGHKRDCAHTGHGDCTAR